MIDEKGKRNWGDQSFGYELKKRKDRRHACGGSTRALAGGGLKKKTRENEVPITTRKKTDYFVNNPCQDAPRRAPANQPWKLLSIF